MSLSQQLQAMLARARGGAVSRSGFVAANEVDTRIFAADEDVNVLLEGGFPDARLLRVTAYPSRIPNMDSGVTVHEFSFVAAPPSTTEQDVRVALNQAGLKPEKIGDVREMRGVWQVALFSDIKPEELGSLPSLGEFSVQSVGGSTAKTQKVREVVVPSLRVDVVGAKGFGVSREAFKAGIAAGKVRLNGQPVTHSSQVREGDSLVAEGLGKVVFTRVVNETRRGNFKVELDVQR